jgi:hypothetical protein
MTIEDYKTPSLTTLTESDQLLRYIYHALPIHHGQMEAIINETEKNNLLLGENFSLLIDDIELSVHKSNEIKDRLLSSDLSDEHFEEIKVILNQLIETTTSVQSSISKITISLQNQDSTKQVLTHIQDNIQEICEEIKEFDETIQVPESQDASKLQKKISSHYTMKSERDVFNHVTGLDSGEVQGSNDDDELTFF